MWGWGDREWMYEKIIGVSEIKGKFTLLRLLDTPFFLQTSLLQIQQAAALTLIL